MSAFGTYADPGKALPGEPGWNYGDSRLLASDNLIKYPKLEFKTITLYQHWCHRRGSLTSLKVSSQNPNRAEVCNEEGMVSGQAYPMRYECSDENGNLTRIEYSTLPYDEACS